MPPIPSLVRPLAAIFLFVTSCCLGQEAINVTYANTTDQSGFQSIQFNFDLSAPYANVPCFVRVKYTTDSRTFYLTQVKGDVGNLVYPGPGKHIVWDYKEELIHNTSAEQVTIDIEVFPNLSTDRKIKRGKNMVVNLDDVYEKGKSYSIKLYRNEQVIATLIDSIALQTHFVAPIPKKTKTGKNHQIGIVGGEKILFTNAFKVRPRISTFWKILPFVGVPAYIFVKGQYDELKDLPGAPSPPAN